MLLKVATPTFSPVNGTYSSAQSVVIQCSTSGAIIRYTTDGSEPSSSSTVYSGSFLISTTTSVRAKASLSGMTDSETASVIYIISTGTSSQDPMFGYTMVYAAIAIFAIVVLVGVVVLYLRNRKKP